MLFYPLRLLLKDVFLNTWLSRVSGGCLTASINHAFFVLDQAQIGLNGSLLLVTYLFKRMIFILIYRYNGPYTS